MTNSPNDNVTLTHCIETVFIKSNEYFTAAVSELSKFNQNPGIAHWEGVKRVLRYVSGTVGEGLLYKRGAQVEVWVL